MKSTTTIHILTGQKTCSKGQEETVHMAKSVVKRIRPSDSDPAPKMRIVESGTSQTSSPQQQKRPMVVILPASASRTQKVGGQKTSPQKQLHVSQVTQGSWNQNDKSSKTVSLVQIQHTQSENDSVATGQADQLAPKPVQKTYMYMQNEGNTEGETIVLETPLEDDTAEYIEELEEENVEELDFATEQQHMASKLVAMPTRTIKMAVTTASGSKGQTGR